MANIYTSTTVLFDNGSSKGIGDLPIALETISTGTVNVGAADQFVFTFPNVPGLKIRAVQTFANGTATLTSIVMGTSSITTSTLTIQGVPNTVVGYTVTGSVASVVGTGTAVAACVAYYG